VTRIGRLATGTVCLLVLVGCEPAPPPEDALLGSLPTLEPTENLRIGSVDDPEAGFSAVTGVEVDRDGNLYVLEAQEKEVRVFDREGIRIRTLGREGEGPGEFRYVSRFGLVGDTVWVLDYGLQRTTLFHREGPLLSTGSWAGVSVAFGSGGSTGNVGPFQMRRDGLFTSRIVGIAVAMGAGPSQDSLRIPEVLFHPSGAVVDTVGWEVQPPAPSSSGQRVEVGGTGYSVPRPPSDGPLRAEFPDGLWLVKRPVARADTVSRLSLTRLDLQGDTALSRLYRYAPRRYSDEVLDSLAMPINVRRRAARSGADPEAVMNRIRAAMEVPEFQPPVLETVAGPGGTLWLRREDGGGLAHRWLIVGPDGTPRGHVEVLRRSRVRWVGEEEFVTVERDEYDVPWVVRFRLEG
jgi:hypothetical protein